MMEILVAILGLWLVSVALVIFAGFSIGFSNIVPKIGEDKEEEQ